ncbi:hypothetical protein GCM10025865_05670 [Paraoerskovia sediminicola]|uniref:NADH:quinone oxidoreductase/Mrp antiporter transmembrane domain-containing protein n=2 Tax=Paraoerskovia sediminicola TaxID=1138587 RepID=A0ABM8FZL6_9CELL|nr:hypothetical protein GCM10025865_05670 [Paraoerskovia sediminicola]
MAACTKAAAFGALIRVLVIVGAGLQVGLPDAYQALEVGLWTFAIASMVVGSVVTLVQVDVKRILGYSAIAHTGFLLVGVIGLLSLVGTAGVGSALPSLIFYLLAYGLATVGAFTVVTLVRETSRSATVGALVGAAGSGAGATTAAADGAGATGPVTTSGASDGSASDDETAVEPPVVLGEATHLSQWAGLGRRSPWLAALYSLFLLSMAGIPLTAGFVAKFGVFSAAVAGGDWVLALVGVLSSAVAVFFYVRIIVLMYFTPADEDAAVTVVAPKPLALIALFVCAVGVIGLGIFPSPVLGLLG